MHIPYYHHHTFITWSNIFIINWKQYCLIGKNRICRRNFLQLFCCQVFALTCLISSKSRNFIFYYALDGPSTSVSMVKWGHLSTKISVYLLYQGTIILYTVHTSKNVQRVQMKKTLDYLSWSIFWIWLNKSEDQSKGDVMVRVYKRSMPGMHSPSVGIMFNVQRKKQIDWGKFCVQSTS